MSKKQLGAAMNDETEPAGGAEKSWWGRVRAQPGFRTAIIAFVLTVVLGVGGTAAYAYWIQKTDLAITGTTPLPVLPIPEQPVCSSPPFNVTRIEWKPAAGVDPGAYYVLTFRTPDTTVSYAVPLDYTAARPTPKEPYNRRVEPYNLANLNSELGFVWRNTSLQVTVATAILDIPTSGVPVQISQDRIPRGMVESTPRALVYSTPFGVAGYSCG